MNDAKNLTSLNFSALNQLRAALSATNQLIQQAQGLAFNLSQMATDAGTRWRNSLEALRTATKVQSQGLS